MSTTGATTPSIPTYSLAQCSRQGPAQFYIAAGGEGGLVPRAEFLTPHRKDFYFLVLVRQGGGRHWVDMHPYTHQANTIYLTAPHQVRLVEQAPAAGSLALGFTADFLGLNQLAGGAALPVLAATVPSPVFSLQAADLAFLEPVLAHMQAEYAHPRPWQLEMLRADLQVLLLHLSRLYPQQHFAPAPVEPTLLTAFAALVEAHHATRHQVAEYAALLHLSPGYLNERVRQLSGQPALAHIRARLVLEAKRQLFHTSRRVAEISFALGFEDPSYFGRFFRRATGQSPARYRQATREMYQQNAG